MYVLLVLALFDAHHDSAPLSPDDLIRLNRKISHQQVYIYTYTCTALYQC